MLKSKIALLGPVEAGKSTIANFLAEASDNVHSQYKPTQGVRILEMEIKNLQLASKSVSVEVELWDCSGDLKFESCWPALAKDLNGAMMVYNSDVDKHDKDLDLLYRYFIAGQHLKDNQCIVLNNRKSTSNDKIRSEPSGLLAKCVQISSNVDEDPEGLRSEFRAFMVNVCNRMSDKREQVEQSIMEDNFNGSKSKVHGTEVHFGRPN